MPALNSTLHTALSGDADLAQLMIKARADLQILADFCATVAMTA